MEKGKVQRMIAGLLGGLMVFSLAGCGSGGGSADTKSTDNAAAQTTPAASEEEQNSASEEAVKEITLWEIQTEEPMREIFADSIARFEADHPGYKINDVSMGSEDYKQKIAIALGSNTAPDIFVTWTGGGMKEYIEAGCIADLTDYMNKDNYKDYFMDAAVAQTMEDGKLWAVPVENCSIAAIFYNKALFEKYNIAIPKTVEELESVCDAFLENGISPFALPNKTKYFASMYYMYLVDRQAGPELFESAANGGDRTFEDEVFTWADNKMQEWAQKGYFGEGYNGLDGETGIHRTMFYNEECAMLLDGSWCVSTFYNDQPDILGDIGVFPFPAIEGGKGDPGNLVGTLGDTFYCISSEAEDKDICFEAIKYLIDDTALQKRVAAGRIPPTKNATAENEISEELMKLLQEAKSIQLWYDQYLPSDAAEIHKDSLQALVGLSMTPEEYNKAMSDAVNK